MDEGVRSTLSCNDEDAMDCETTSGSGSKG
jgi:hypothetical protein